MAKFVALLSLLALVCMQAFSVSNSFTSASLRMGIALVFCVALLGAVREQFENN